jgi:hypothetical protein
LRLARQELDGRQCETLVPDHQRGGPVMNNVIYLVGLVVVVLAVLAFFGLR